MLAGGPLGFAVLDPPRGFDNDGVLGEYDVRGECIRRSDEPLVILPPDPEKDKTFTFFSLDRACALIIVVDTVSVLYSLSQTGTFFVLLEGVLESTLSLGVASFSGGSSSGGHCGAVVLHSSVLSGVKAFPGGWVSGGHCGAGVLNPGALSLCDAAFPGGSPASGEHCGVGGVFITG